MCLVIQYLIPAVLHKLKVESIGSTTQCPGDVRMKNISPRNAENWKDHFRRDAHRRPGWKVLPVEILFSEAFIGLKTKGAQVALLYAHSQISYERKNKRPGKRRQIIYDTVFLPSNALHALGITASATRTKIRNELVEKGFLDVLKSGSFLNAAVFRVSDRWRQYPNGDYRPKEDQPKPGLCMGHRFPKRESHDDVSENSISRSANERSSYSVDERKEPETPLGLFRSSSERKHDNSVRSTDERCT
jgi:hypothetical protein